MKVLVRLIFLALISFTAGSAHAQQGAAYDIQVNIIYRLTKYIDWPDKSGDFVIGVVGTPAIFEYMSGFLTGKTVGTRKIVLKKFPSASPAYPCQLLFIPEEENHMMRKIAGATAGAGTLLVTESEGMARRGSCINFIVVDDRIKLEINKNNIEQRNLRIAGELLALGILVK
ncbi:MAG TPA: YfiR family protein [Puia sp.]|uniref:YfiR family protein n=1 Tax=Puia sp. TaxID=2045100 RepID=UPI002C438ADF|nr:YfiR family protein [Puia sp.]HVU96315.1 YfiR family protein [Puia sp.]